MAIHRHLCSHVHSCSAPQPTTPTFVNVLQTRGNMVCITSLNNQLFVTGTDDWPAKKGVNRRGNHTVQVYDPTTFQSQGNISVSGLQQVCGLVSCAMNNCLYASDPSTSSVFRIELSGKITNWSVSTQPAGLSVNSVNNILVTFPSQNCVREYTTHGSLVREIVLPRGFIASLNHVIQLTNGQFVVSSNRGVCIVNADGQIVSLLEGSIQLNQPMALALVGNGCILVADRGLKQIVILHPSMTSWRVLALPTNVELKGPRSLHFDEPRGRLYIGDDKEVNQKVFQYEYSSTIGYVGIFILDNVFNVGNDLN